MRLSATEELIDVERVCEHVSELELSLWYYVNVLFVNASVPDNNVAGSSPIFVK